MLKLAPSILSADFSRLGKEIKTIEEAGAHYLHIDVMDGHFVPNISVGGPVVESIRKITDMTFDVHLMISEPQKYIEAFADMGADIINFHLEADGKPLEIIRKIKSLGKRAAITIKPATEAERVFEYLPEVDLVLVMSVEPGFGGQELIPETLVKAARIADFIAQNNLLTELEMDGGISLNNVTDVLDSGVNVVVAGSAVFASGDAAGAVRDFYSVFAAVSRGNIC